MYPPRAQHGFTLIELLLSIAIIGIISALSIPVYQSVQVRNDTDIAATTTAQSIRRAQALSRAMDGPTPWGVHVEPGAIVLFTGADYGSRDASYDEGFTMPTTIAVSGQTDFVFERLNGNTQSGTLTFTSTVGHARTLTINEKGVITY